MSLLLQKDIGTLEPNETMLSLLFGGQIILDDFRMTFFTKCITMAAANTNYGLILVLSDRVGGEYLRATAWVVTLLRNRNLQELMYDCFALLIDLMILVTVTFA